MVLIKSFLKYEKIEVLLQYKWHMSPVLMFAQNVVIRCLLWKLIQICHRLRHYYWHIIIDFIDSHSYKRIAIIVIISNFLLIEKKKFIKQIVEKFTKTFIPIIKCFEWTLRPFPRLSVLDIHAIISIRHFIDY